MAEVWRLDLSPGASVWLAGMPTTDGYFELPPTGLDTRDPLYPNTWTNEGLKYNGSGGPHGEPCLDADPLYDPPYGWQVAAWVPIHVGPLPSLGYASSFDGAWGKWNMNKGRWVSRSYIDSAVRSDAGYLISLGIYSGEIRSSNLKILIILVQLFRFLYWLHL